MVVIGGFRRMTGEQRSGDGWQEKREKGKRGVRVEDGDFFFFGG